MVYRGRVAPAGPPSDPPSRPGRRPDRQIADWDWGDDEWDAPSRPRNQRGGAASAKPSPGGGSPDPGPAAADDRTAEATLAHDRGAPTDTDDGRDSDEPGTGGRAGNGNGSNRGNGGNGPRPPRRPRPGGPSGPNADAVRRRRLLAGGGGLALLLLLVIVVVAVAGGGDDEPAKQAATGDRRLLAAPLALASSSAVDQLSRMQAVDRYAQTGLPVYCGSGRKPWVALTFDDGPGELSPKFISLLTKEKVPVTMFRIGRNVPGREEFVRVQRNLGWDSGSHTLNHPALATLSEKDQRTEIDAGNRASQRALGRPPQLFRPPYESHNATTDRIIKENDQVQVLWNVDTQDALGATTSASIAETAIKGLHPGSIILMHEVKPNTFAALPKIIAEMRKRKLVPVTVSKMLAEDGPSKQQLEKGFDGCRVDLTPGKAAS